MRFLPSEFEVPELLEHDRFRLRPLTIHDVVKDYDAVMSLGPLGMGVPASCILGNCRLAHFKVLDGRQQRLVVGPDDPSPEGLQSQIA